MGKMHKNRKQAGGHGTPREETDMQEQEMDIRKIMKDVENFSNVHFLFFILTFLPFSLTVVFIFSLNLLSVVDAF